MDDFWGDATEYDIYMDEEGEYYAVCTSTPYEESTCAEDIENTQEDIAIEKDFKKICADDIDDCVVKYEHLMDNHFSFYTYDDVLSGLIDNLSDTDIDKEITKFSEYSKVLKVKPENIVTGKQIGRASCRERVSSPV